ncbi:hypothetical protein D6833_08005 [Candidatus Parcubacteria bacterium]|nr:MAG: hypothetical protein D6833_08005 [Candidatus Parcubacteria bacterium]
MLLKIDYLSASCFDLISITTNIGDDIRHHYVHTQGRLARLVLRNGLTLEDIAGRTVDVAIGWETARRGFAAEEDIGRRRTKITVFRIVTDHPEKNLRSVLIKSPRRKKRRKRPATA